MMKIKHMQDKMLLELQDNIRVVMNIKLSRLQTRELHVSQKLNAE